MAQLINFDNYQIPKSDSAKVAATSYSGDHQQTPSCPAELEDLFRITLDVLVRNNPDKILFSLKEAAKQLTVGEEFLRRRIKSGKIKVTYLGDKPLINIVELARIITEGV
jgi:excisionase family DNA binding protein